MNDTQYHEILKKVFPTVNECYLIQKQMGATPVMILEGMVLGYLLGKGFTLEEASVGKIQYMRTMNNLAKQYPEVEEVWSKGTEIKFSTDGKYEKVN